LGSKKRRKERALQSLVEGEDDAGLTLDAQSNDRSEDNIPPALGAHPEEMRGTVELRITDHVTLKASARATPAGLVGAAILLFAILVPVMWNRRHR
jgi:hypothetical protein